MKFNKLFLVILPILFFSFASKAANVTSVNEGDPLTFGTLVLDQGTIGTIGSTTSSCFPYSGLTSLGGCLDYTQFSLTTQNEGKGSNKQNFRLFLSQNASVMSTNDTQLFYSSINGDVTCEQPFSHGDFKIVDCINNPSGDDVIVSNIKVKITAKLSGISAQNTAYQSGSYTFAACRCGGNGCTNSINCANCTKNGWGSVVDNNINTDVLKNIAIQNNYDLDFGEIASGSSTSIVSETGNVLSGDAVAIASSRSAGQFTVIGQEGGGIYYNITLPLSINLICQDSSCSGASAMPTSLSFYIGSTSVNSGSSTRNLNYSGNDIYTVKGNLTVGANQQAGTYTGLYNITVNYQ